nr:3066_t:CDS:2 [Entrophospora candida]
MKPTITKLEYEKIKKDALVIDVRSKLEHTTLPNLPNSNRSGQVAEFLHQQGYQIFVLEGGIENYFKEKVKETIKKYLRILNQYGKRKIDTESISDFLRENLTKCEPATLRSKRNALASYNLEKLKNVRTQIKTNARDSLIIEFLYYTGLRINELINLKHSDYINGLLRIHGKGNKVRYIPLPPFLTQYFDPYSRQYLFLTRNGKKLTKGQIRRNILETIQKQLGHYDVNTTLGYIHNDYQTLYADYKILREKLLIPRNISPSDLATALKVPKEQIQRICEERGDITPDLATLRRRLRITSEAKDKRDFAMFSGFRLEPIAGTKNHWSIRTGSGA